jgi:ketosteroid isomerase-like protein
MRGPRATNDTRSEMRTSAWVLAVVALATTTACSTPKGEEFTTSDAATIRQKNQEFVEAFNGKQVPKILSLYADNSVFMPPNTPTIRGRGALEGYYSDQFRQGAGDLKLEVAEVSGHGPLAYQTGVYELDYRRDSRHDRGKYLFVMRNMSGTWRLQYAMWSSDLPVEDAHAKTD